MNLCVQNLEWISVFLSLGYIYLGVEPLGHVITLHLTSFKKSFHRIFGFNFLRNCKLFFQAAALPWWFQFFHILVVTALSVFLNFFYYTHPSVCEVVRHCGFYMCFPNG